MTVKTTTLFVTLLLVATWCFGQKSAQVNDNVRVFYKDGSVFNGRVIGVAPSSIKLVLSTTDTINLATVLIKRINNTRDHLNAWRGRFFYKKGIFADLALGVGSHNLNTTTQVEAILGLRKSPNLSLGMGIAIETNDARISTGWLYHTFISPFGYGRYYIYNGPIRAFADMKVGYGIAGNQDFFNEHSSGILIQPGFGVHFPTKGKLKWYLGVSQYMQHTKGENNEMGPFGPIISSFDMWYNRTVFKVGIEFK